MNLSLQRNLRAGLLTLLWFACNFGWLFGVRATEFVFQRGTVRLVGGDKTKGRLEVRPRVPLDTWQQVCAGDDRAQLMCQQLGYKFGRKYDNAPVTMTTTSSSSSASRIRFVSCMTGAIGQQPQQGGRRLLSTTGWIDLPDTQPRYTCMFMGVTGSCDSSGAVMAIQCSNTSFPLQRPPPPAPPSPPSPPPPPPRVSNQIRFFFLDAEVPSDGDLERNMCNFTSGAMEPCVSFARVEVLVDLPIRRVSGSSSSSSSSSSSGGRQIWAPVCNVSHSGLALAVAQLACEQRYKHEVISGLAIENVTSNVSATPHLVPNGPVTDDKSFNPNSYSGWFTITGGNTTAARRLQDLSFTVSTLCSRRAMLAIRCNGLPRSRPSRWLR